MEVIETKAQLAETAANNVLPPSLPAASPEGQLAVDAYQNVQVLGHLSAAEFTRLMTAMTLWVAPNDGCGYCHAPERDAKGGIVKNDEGFAQADLKNMQSDELYTKRVARRMLQMTMRINGDWKHHVQETGVTCYTCHRGNHVPTNVWFDEEPTAASASDLFEDTPGRLSRGPTVTAGLTSLPAPPFRAFLGSDENIRVQSTQALETDNRHSIKQTEYTYALMMHMSNALGVNCTYCHNSRSMGEWSTSPATRATAWYGIRMVRELNADYLEPLQGVVPKERLGPMGDPPKANCATCHAGAYKPLLGASMLADYRALAEARPQPAKTPPPPPAAANPAPELTPAAADGGTRDGAAGPASAASHAAPAPAGASSGARPAGASSAAHP
jgi:photosynthetic reaction center cytochrome c subunit